MLKFVAYSHQFDADMNGSNVSEKDNFLLSMKHVSNGDSLASVAKDRGYIHIQILLSKYTVSSSSVLNDIFSEYSDYVNKTFNSIRNEVSDVSWNNIYFVVVVGCCIR